MRMFKNSLVSPAPTTILDSAQPPLPGLSEKERLLQLKLAHQERLAQIQLERDRMSETRNAQRRQERLQAHVVKAQHPRLLALAWRAWQRQRAQGRQMVQRKSLRHVIQEAGHEYLALILMLAAAGGSLLFFLGRYYGNAVPLYLVIPTAAALALSIEWATLTFGQDLQDSLTLHQPASFLINLVKAVIAYSVSVFMMANAASVVWAPLDNLLGIDTKTWAWALAVTVFGVQFLLKLAPERPKAAKTIIATAHFVAMMAPDTSPEEQVVIVGRMLSAFAGDTSPLLQSSQARHSEPAPLAPPTAPQERQPSEPMPLHPHASLADLVLLKTETTEQASPIQPTPLDESRTEEDVTNHSFRP